MSYNSTRTQNHPGGHSHLHYLLLGISTLFLTGWALSYKMAGLRGSDMRSVSLWLYISATALMLAYHIVSGAKSDTTALCLGAATGTTGYFAILTFLYHIRTGALTVSWTVIALSISFPIVVSILFFGEQPTPRQWVGLALIPVAFILFGVGSSGDRGI